MPVISCPDCNGKVSDSAPACPHCGRAMSPQGSQAAEASPVPSTSQQRPSPRLRQQNRAIPGSGNMNCEKCNVGQMVRDRVFRLSGCVVGIGYTLWVPALLVLLFAIVLTVIGTASTTAAGSTALDTSKKQALARLKQVPNIPAEAITEFEKGGRLSEQTLASLPPEQRFKVNEIQTTYSAGVAGAALGTMGAGCIGGSITLLLYIASIPTLIVGFLLTLRKNIWRCQQCGFIFDRA